MIRFAGSLKPSLKIESGEDRHQHFLQRSSPIDFNDQAQHETTEDQMGASIDLCDDPNKNS